MKEDKLHVPYQPISCDLHSQYELAIMHRKSLKLTWIDEGELITKADIMPLDVQTKNKAEYLIAKTADEVEFILRLDFITDMQVN